MAKTLFQRPPRVLFATDFSPASLHGAGVFRGLAWKLEAELALLHVRDGGDDSACRAALRELHETHFDDRAGVELLCAEHRRPDVAICAGADAFEADLIVVSRHGEHTLGERAFGTTSERVVRNASQSVLVLHPAQDRPLLRAEHILVGSDLSAQAAQAVAAAGHLARAIDAWVVLLSVFDILPPLAVLQEPSAAHDDTSFRGILGDKLEEQRKRLLEGVPGDCRVLRDKNTVVSLCDYALDHKVDLMVLGAHGSSFVDDATRLLMGSVSERALRLAPCHTLIAREGKTG